jgi:predicted ATPase/class 3 adenylate cyclase
MTNQSEAFGRLLRGAINSIAAYEGKSAAAVEEELGAGIGLSGAAIQRYKAGALPPEPRTIQALAEAAVRRGYLGRAWLQRFLQATRHPTPEALLAQLADAPAHGSALPGGTLAFLFTDIEGSSALWEREGAAMERAIMRQTIDAYGGHVFKIVGDAFYAVFTTAADALDAVLAAQRALTAESWGPIGPIRVRAALHVGAAQQRDGDYFGQPLNRVARLCAASHGGQVLLSLAAQELVRDTLPKGAALRDLGEHRLKDLSRPERVFQVVAPDLPSDFPALRSLDSYRHNLPAQATALIGREAEVAAVCEQLRRADTHLLTLTGTGGTGKTRLALQAAAELLDDFRDGVFFAPLASIRDPQLVAAAIAQALGIKEAGDQPLLDLLKAYLRGKQTLLLLDNFEHLAAAAPLVAELLVTAPHLKALVTSRETLHLYGEREYSVPPLSLPDLRRLPPIERLTQYEAVRLFIERAQAVRPDFAVTTENAPAVAEICARLDGLPLAIELAAARSKLFPPKALLARLDKRLQLLTGGPRDLPARQQTLRGAIEWSYDLLDAAEQAIFARLGVFVGGCTLAAAEAVLNDDGRSDSQVAIFIRSDAVLNGLASLIDKSLIKQVESIGDETRFVMLETIQEYALERLEMSGEAEVLRDRHLAYELALAEAADPELPGPKQMTWLNRLEAELDNLRAALQWSVENDVEAGLRLAAALRGFWGIRGFAGEGREWLSQLLLQPTAQAPALTRAKALLAYAFLSQRQGALTLARQLAEESLALYRALGDREGIASSLLTLGSVTAGLGDYAAGRSLLEQSVALLRELGLRPGLALALTTLGAIVSDRDAAQGRLVLEESLAIGRSLGDQIGVGHNLIALGRLALRQGDDTTAQRWLEESLAINRRLGNQVAAYSLVALGELAFHRGEYDQARSYYEESRELNKQAGQDPQDPWLLVRLGYIALRQGDMAGARATFEQSLTVFKRGETKSVLSLSWRGWPAWRWPRAGQSWRCASSRGPTPRGKLLAIPGRQSSRPRSTSIWPPSARNWTRRPLRRHGRRDAH